MNQLKFRFHLPKAKAAKVKSVDMLSTQPDMIAWPGNGRHARVNSHLVKSAIRTP